MNKNTTDPMVIWKAMKEKAKLLHADRLLQDNDTVKADLVAKTRDWVVGDMKDDVYKLKRLAWVAIGLSVASMLASAFVYFK